jgi:hypothetical protein
MMGKYQRLPYYGTLREAVREEDQKIVGEARRSWKELTFLAAGRSGKNS